MSHTNWQNMPPARKLPVRGESIPPPELAPFLSAIFASRGVTGYQASVKLGVSHSVVYRWVNGHRGMSRSNADRIAGVFDLATEDHERLLAILGYLPDRMRPALLGETPCP